MPLALTSVEEIFTRLIARYGMTEWGRKWEGLEEDLVKADWAASLGGIPDENIFHALENLPPTRVPPNAGEFRRICMEYRGPTKTKRLNAPKVQANPARVAREMEKMAAIMKSRSRDRFRWARELKDKAARGENLTPVQRDMLREALRNEIVPTDVPIVIAAIPDEQLPPGMRKNKAP